MSQVTKIREFLSLPSEALPQARFANPETAGNDNAWACLRDSLRDPSQQRLNHFGDKIVLQADRDGWRDGVIVED